MKWFQRSGFHKQTYAERYPFTWSRLQDLNIGIDGDFGMYDTVISLLDHIDELKQRIDQLETEREFS